MFFFDPKTSKDSLQSLRTYIIPRKMQVMGQVQLSASKMNSENV